MLRILQPGDPPPVPISYIPSVSNTYPINPPSHHLPTSTVVYREVFIEKPPTATVSSYQILSTYPLNPHYQPTLSSPLNQHCGISSSATLSSYQHLSTYPFNPPYQPTLSTYTIHPTLSTHPLITSQQALWYIEKCSSKTPPQLLYPPINIYQITLSIHPINPPSHHLSISTVVYREVFIEKPPTAAVSSSAAVKQYYVTVPRDIREGQTFRVSLEGIQCAHTPSQHTLYSNAFLPSQHPFSALTVLLTLSTPPISTPSISTPPSQCTSYLSPSRMPPLNSLY